MYYALRENCLRIQVPMTTVRLVTAAPFPLSQQVKALHVLQERWWAKWKVSLSSSSSLVPSSEPASVTPSKLHSATCPPPKSPSCKADLIISGPNHFGWLFSGNESVAGQKWATGAIRNPFLLQQSLTSGRHLLLWLISIVSWTCFYDFSVNA